MKKFFIAMLMLVFVCVPMLAMATQPTAPQTGFYQNSSGNVFYYDAGENMAGSMTFIGNGSSGGSGGAGGAGGSGGNSSSSATGGAGGNASATGGNAAAFGGTGVGISSSSSRVGDITNSAAGGSVKDSGNSAVGNGIGNFSPSAKVGDVTATGGSATIQKGAIDNKNTNMNIVAPVQSTKVDVDNTNVNKNSNVNVNKTDNTNVNKNTNKQDQDQSQKQAQKQSQKQSQTAKSDQTQSQSADNKGVSQAVIQDYQADKRDLLIAPPAPQSDAKLSNGRAGDIKTKGSLWEDLPIIKKSQADKVISGAGADTLLGPDAKVTVRSVTEKDFQTDIIRLDTKAPVGSEYLGTIYVYSTGSDAIALEALAIREAMKLGGTHIIISGRSVQVVADGKSWNIGIGGGASMFVKGDDIGIAPSGGIGVGGAKASNESVPQMSFKVYCDSSLILTGSMKK